ncbi:MAG: porphobilinogen synthase, partial [Luteibaculum sp.]
MIQNNRPRRNRTSAGIRKLVSETLLHPSKLVLPIFLEDGSGKKIEIPSLPGTYRYSLDTLIPFLSEALSSSIHSFILFPAVEERLKDSTGSYGIHPDNYYLKAVSRLKNEFPDAVFISDLALDPYNIDGHDGIVRDGEILNDETLEVLGKMAQVQA